MQQIKRGRLRTQQRGGRSAHTRAAARRAQPATTPRAHAPTTIIHLAWLSRVGAQRNAGETNTGCLDTRSLARCEPSPPHGRGECRRAATPARQALAATDQRQQVRTGPDLAALGVQAATHRHCAAADPCLPAADGCAGGRLPLLQPQALTGPLQRFSDRLAAAMMPFATSLMHSCWRSRHAGTRSTPPPATAAAAAAAAARRQTRRPPTHALRQHTSTPC